MPHSYRSHVEKLHWATVTFPLIGLMLVLVVVSGCRLAQEQPVAEYGDNLASYRNFLTQIEYPDVDDESLASAQAALSAKPLTISDYEATEFRDMSLEEAVHLALSNSKILSRLGGQVISAPNIAISSFDPAVQESSPLNGVEGALSAFDARWDTTFNFLRSERKFNNLFFGAGAPQLISNNSNFITGLSKRSSNGATFGARTLIDYARNNSPANRFPSAYDMLIQAEYRQPLLRGAGTLVNRVAGPNATPGIYNGVLIARFNHDITLADFEAGVRNLVRDVERTYWELYFGYANLNNLIKARDAARDVWEKKDLRKQSLDNPDEEAIARQQYFNFAGQVENALAGNGVNLGVFGAERELRRLCGLNAADGQLLRPTSEPIVADIKFDWDDLQIGAMEKRVELRRQQWTVQQRELEYLAAQNLNRWQLDFVGNYGWRGFGDNLAGSRSRIEGSALEDLSSGDLDDFNLGFEFGGPIGKRQTHLAVRNAELQLAKARAVLREQQRQVVLDLNAAFTESDRAFHLIKTNYNSRVAIQDEYRPKKNRYDVGNEAVFFLLDVQQRAANVESAYVRSIVDYNLALLDVNFQSGRLLDRYNIQLMEGPWSDPAYEIAADRNLKYSGR